MKIYNKNNLLPGKLGGEWLVFEEDKTFSATNYMIVECNNPTITLNEEQEETAYPIDSLTSEENFMVEAKPLVKDLSLYKDKENPWTNETFVMTKFEKVIPVEEQLDIEGNAPINHIVAFTSTDGNTLNVKEMTTHEVWSQYTEKRPFDKLEIASTFKVDAGNLKVLVDIFNEFAKTESSIEMSIDKSGKIYFQAHNHNTEQIMKGILSTIPIDNTANGLTNKV